MSDHVIIKTGTSCLTRDLVWCECGRGISLSGKWGFCPKCGSQIDQESYRAAIESALANGAKLYKRDSDDDHLLTALDAAQSEIAELRTQLAAALKGRTMSCICGGEAQRDSELLQFVMDNRNELWNTQIADRKQINDAIAARTKEKP